MTKRTLWSSAPLLLGLLGVVALLWLPSPNSRLFADPTDRENDSRSSAFVARVYYDRIADLDGLSGYDVWEYNNTKEKYVLVSMDSVIFEELSRLGWTLVVDRNRSEALARSLQPAAFEDGYRTVDQMYAELAVINANHPDLTELVDYGDSFCKEAGGCTTPGGDSQPGYDLLAIRVSNELIGSTSYVSGTAVIGGTKPVFFVIANIHAREITTSELARRLFDWFIDGYGVDADVGWMVDWHEIWIVPMANPDGHWLVELGERSPYLGGPFYQRKNANRGGGCSTWLPTSFSQYGVDLNRNHSFAWGGIGSSGSPCDQTYRGAAAASEPEVAQLQALVQSLIPDQRGPGILDAAPADTTGLFITMHSFGELVLWPWGFSTQQAPNATGLQSVGDRLASFNGYRSCQPTTCLYAASGTSDDWAYADLGIPAFTFEVGTDFMPPYSEVDSIQWSDNASALQYAARIARAPYLTVLGPDVLGITTVLSAPGIISITATIDDRLNGDRPIAGASFTIDEPYWITGTVSYDLLASDGSLDSSFEEVAAALDLADLTFGRHQIFLRGMDIDGNLGPLYSTYIHKRQSYNYYFPVWIHGSGPSLSAPPQG